MFNTLSGRFLILTIIFVMLAEVLIFVPTVARFREDYLLSRLERAQIASLALLADDMIDGRLRPSCCAMPRCSTWCCAAMRCGNLCCRLRCPSPSDRHSTCAMPARGTLIRDAMQPSVFDSEDEVIRVIGNPVQRRGPADRSHDAHGRVARHGDDRLRGAHSAALCVISVSQLPCCCLSPSRFEF